MLGYQSSNPPSATTHVFQGATPRDPCASCATPWGPWRPAARSLNDRPVAETLHGERCTDMGSVQCDDLLYTYRITHTHIYIYAYIEWYRYDWIWCLGLFENFETIQFHLSNCVVWQGEAMAPCFLPGADFTFGLDIGWTETENHQIHPNPW